MPRNLGLVVYRRSTQRGRVGTQLDGIGSITLQQVRGGESKGGEVIIPTGLPADFIAVTGLQREICLHAASIHRIAKIELNIGVQPHVIDIVVWGGSYKPRQDAGARA